MQFPCWFHYKKMEKNQFNSSSYLKNAVQKKGEPEATRLNNA